MVYWYLKEETAERVIYEYYPEHDKDKRPSESPLIELREYDSHIS